MAITVDQADLDKDGYAFKKLEESKANTPPADGAAGTPPATLPATPPATPPADASTPPASDTPPGTPPPTPPAAPDYTGMLKDLFGEDIKDLDTAKSRLKELQTSKPATTETKFANDYIKGLNEYVEKGGSKEIYDRVSTVKVNDLTPFDTMKTLMKWENPELSDSDIEIYLNDKYRQTEEDSESEKKTGNVKMAIEAKAAKEKLVAIQQQHSVPEPERQRQDEAKQEIERVKAWEPSVKKTATELNKIGIKLDDKNTFDYTVTDAESQAALEQELGHIIKYSGLELNDKNLEVFANIAKERFIVKNFEKIASAIYTQARTLIEAETRKTYNNDEPLKRGDIPPGGQKKTNADTLYEKHAREAGIRP